MENGEQEIGDHQQEPYREYQANDPSDDSPDQPQDDDPDDKHQQWL
jgi:hypothetical protein